ncbi:MAG: DUF507 family protein [Nitrospirae bacterium]|nr:DUF507 family protein [Nitrospirota bacterium]
MKLTPMQVRSLSDEMVSQLSRHGLVKLRVPAETASAMVEKALTDDLQAEDRLNEEVEKILKAHERDIAAGRMDYKTMFDLVKKKLVRERGLVL